MSMVSVSDIETLLAALIEWKNRFVEKAFREPPAPARR
jgi:hypothetical protein